MRILGLDTETTGLDQAKGHRIIEVAGIHAEWDGTRMSLLRKFTKRINPERSIDPDAQAVHHISAVDLAGEPLWPEVAPAVMAQLYLADVVVCHNASFDGPFLAAELLRVGLTPPPVEIFCTMEAGRWATGQGKLPRLGELCWALGVAYDESKAHAAEYDVIVMLQCLAKGLKRGFYQLPAVAARRAA
jgi:DNA polymerase-3 subunit epsilon